MRPSSSADRILVARRIHPLGDAAPCEALLLRAGRVAATGTETEMRAAAPAGAEIIRLPTATVAPGITDAHVHLSAWALARRRVELHDAATADEAVERVRTASSGGDEWIRGGGWDANRWGAFPTREALDAAAPGRPVVLDSHDLHAFWLSSEALSRCGITAGTPDPEGGEIVRDPATGQPTGVLLEHAKRLVEPHLPATGWAELGNALEDAQAQLHRWGVTGIHSVEPDGLADFQRLREAGRLRLRVTQSIPLARLDAALALGVRSGFGDGWIRLGGVKVFLDGALGSRTALLREPYPDGGGRGIETLPLQAFRDAVRRAARGGIASTVHAIGDAAVERALDVLGEVPAPAAMPHRIEHLQLCPPELWERAARSGITLSMQPVHLRSDIGAAERFWGHERSRGAYAFAPLLRAGGRLAFGSDVPVETADPRQGIHAAVRRVGWDGTPEAGWFPEHAVSVEAALRAYTEGPARAVGEDGHRGRLLPGCDADLVAWDRDPLACPVEEILRMRPLLTMVAGETVHRDEG
jgi:predicted amidohydrolase YtcJ